MNLSNQQIQDFIEAWRKDFDETLSFEAAKDEATRLVDFFAQMEDALRTQRALVNKANRPSDPPPVEDIKGKVAWRKMMGKRSLYI